MNVFVGNLSKETDERNIIKIFRPYGMLKSVKMERDLGTGRFRGSAIVEMYTRPEAVEAVEKLNNTAHEGRKLMLSLREKYI
jgi:RNA recognition motif-containing protein